MADERLAQALPPEQLQQIAQIVLEGMRGDIQALLKATAQAPAIPPPNRPPIEFDGLDARQMERLKRELLIETKDFIRTEIEDFLPDVEIEDRIKRGSDGVARQIETLKADLLRDLRVIVHDEVDGLRTEFFEIWADMDLPLEKGAPRKATREKIEGLVAMHQGSKEFKSELWKSIRAAVIGQITLVVLGALAFFGFKGGGGH